jgi:hypothetical protein
MDGAGADLEQAERLVRERIQEWLLNLEQGQYTSFVGHFEVVNLTEGLLSVAVPRR